MRKLGIILTCILGLILLMGCQKKELPKFLVPSDVNLLAEVQVSKILADGDWEQVYATVPIPPEEKPATLKDALDKLFEETGVDVRSFTQATVFARIPNDIIGASEAYVGVILLGTFDEAKFVQNVKEKSGEEFTTQSYEGYTLYLERGETAGFAFVGNDTLVGGTVQALKDALSVATGKKSALSGTLRETYDGLGTPLLKLALSLPAPLRQQILQGLAGGGGMPFDLSSVADIDMLALTGDKVKQDVTLVLKGHYSNAEAAQKAQNIMEGARLLFSGMIPVPELSSFLNKVQVSKQESWVNLSLKTTVDEVKGLVQAIPKLGQPTPEEARRAEFHDVNIAVTALMVENNLTTIPNRVTANTAPCTTGTQNMTAYPDTTSDWALVGGKTKDPKGNNYVAGDKAGYVLFGHDITGGGSATSVVNYVNFQKTKYCYTIDADGTVHQYDEAGRELTP